MSIVQCDRCKGNKQFNCFKHIDGGVCFKCEGTGTIHSSRLYLDTHISGSNQFSHTLVDGEVTHIFQSSADGTCEYWVNNEDTFVSSKHLVLSLNGLRTKYREVRDFIKSIELYSLIGTIEYRLEQGAYDTEEVQTALVAELNIHRIEYATLTGE